MALQTFTDGQILTAENLTILQANNGLQLITRIAVSGSSSQALDNVFTSTYKNYLILVDNCFGSTAGARLQFQYRYAGPTTQAASYYSAFTFGNPASGTVNNLGANNNASFAGLCFWNTSTSAGSVVLTVQGVAISGTQKPTAMGEISDSYSAFIASGGFVQDVARNYTGFILTPSAGTFTANVSVYGYGEA